MDAPNRPKKGGSGGSIAEGMRGVLLMSVLLPEPAFTVPYEVQNRCLEKGGRGTGVESETVPYAGHTPDEI
jgi:hypothetical protein